MPLGGAPPGRPVVLRLVDDGGCEPGIPGLAFWFGPCLDNIISFILFCMSVVRLLARGGGGPGRLAALIGPRGEEVDDIVGAVMLGGVRNDGGLSASIASGSSPFGASCKAGPLRSKDVSVVCSWADILGRGVVRLSNHH